jgi:hypothetical protein
MISMFLCVKSVFVVVLSYIHGYEKLRVSFFVRVFGQN